MTTIQLGESGIVLGGVDALDVKWIVKAGSDPWSPGPAPREVTGDRPNDHGSWDATEFYASRSLQFGGFAHGSHDRLHQAKHRLMAAVGVAPFVLTTDEPFYGRRLATCRRDGEVLWSELSTTRAQWTVSLMAPDPRIFGESAKSASTGYPSSTGGLVWPATWPATWDAVVESGQMVLTNEGDSPAPVLWRIDGPITDPLVVDLDSGARMRLVMDIPDGDWVTVDTATHRVLYRGEQGATRRSLWSGQWLGVAPGSHQFGLSAAAGGPAARLSATWHDTWI